MKAGVILIDKAGVFDERGPLVDGPFLVQKNLKMMIIII